MVYIRKTCDEYDIEQLTSEGWEVVSCELTHEAARSCKRDYRQNQPEYPVRITKRRVKIQTPGTLAPAS